MVSKSDNKNKYRHITCTQQFRDLIAQYYPGLNHPKNKAQRNAYWSLFLYCLCGKRNEEGKLLLCWQILSELEYGSVITNYSAQDFLYRFLHDVFEGDTSQFDWREYHRPSGKARELKAFNLNSQVQQAYERERNTRSWVGTKRVYFVTGSVFCGKKQKRIRDEYKQQADQTLDNLPEIMQQVVEKLNQQSTNTFTRLVKNNHDYAVETANRLPNQEARKAALNTLYCVKDLPQPVYKGSDKPGSTRIYAFGQNLTQLSRPVRAALFQGVYSVDLASIQLAIAAAVLGVETITEFLSQGNSFWTELLDYYQIQPEHRAVAKSILKESTYSLVFRAESHNVKRNLTVAFKKLNITKAGQKFYDHPFIQELDAAMEQKGEEIIKAGGFENAFGQYIPYQDNVKSSLALLFQSYESYLISSVYELPFDNMSVVAHLHDGLYISFRNQKYYQLLSKKIEAAVNQRLEELNVPSRLEWENVDEEKVEIELQAKQLEHQIKTNTLELANPVMEQESESVVEEVDEPEIPYQYTKEWFIDEQGKKLDFPGDIIYQNRQKQHLLTRMKHIAEIKRGFEDLAKSSGIELVAS